jgi:hypothetical protein
MTWQQSSLPVFVRTLHKLLCDYRAKYAPCLGHSVCSGLLSIQGILIKDFSDVQKVVDCGQIRNRRSLVLLGKIRKRQGIESPVKEPTICDLTWSDGVILFGQGVV